MVKKPVIKKMNPWWSDPLLIAAGGLVLLGLSLSFWYWQAPPRTVLDTAASQLQTAAPSPLPVAPIPIMENASGAAILSARADQLTHQFSATLSARAVYAIDLPSASVLLAKNATAAAYPASTTKLMTALVARKAYNLDDVVEVATTDQAAGSIVGFKPGEKFTVTDLLAAALIQSGNDAATTLADHYQGGRPAFIQAMNQMAQQLHMTQTVYSNPTGIDATAQRTTARDLSLVARQVWLDPVLQHITDTQSLDITSVDGKFQHHLTSTNELLGKEPGVMGLKTGTTALAQEVLVTVTQRDGHQVLIVLMGSQNRYDDTRAILNWIYNHYHWYEPAQLTTIPVAN